VLEEAGADPSRVIFGHMTRTFPPSAAVERAKLAEKGCYLEFDWFGRDGDQPASLVGGNERVNDVTRIHQIIDLVNEGYGDNILVSHDICFKVMLRSYGGGGYGYILNTAVPEMLKMGLGQDIVDNILVDNPRRALSFI
jgi:phosphotriesterase-related protein